MLRNMVKVVAVAALPAIAFLLMFSSPARGNGAIVIHKDTIGCSVNVFTSPTSFYQGPGHAVITPNGKQEFNCRAPLIFGPGVSPAQRFTTGACEIVVNKNNAIMTCHE